MATPHRALQSSRVAALYRRTSATLDRSWQSSNALQLLERVERSRLVNWLAQATTHSFCYRWLTTEPEPEVIVIDLRETYTVGPVIALLDRLIDALAPIWRTSTLKRATDGLVNRLEAATETRTGRTIVKLLEPPEPRDSRRDD